jgi:transcriptional regulator with XRE-family HTH domain
MADFARGERIRQLREHRHLSQEDAAHQLGVSVKSLRAWEHGGGIRWRNAQALGELYGVSAEELVSREALNGNAEVIELVGATESAQILERLDRLEASLSELRQEIHSGRTRVLAELSRARTALEAQSQTRSRPSRGRVEPGG